MDYMLNMKNKTCIISPKANKDKSINEELITIVLLADSPGYRMKSYGAIPLIQFKNKKLIDIQIQQISNTFKNFELIICVGYDSDKVCKYIKQKYRNKNIRIVENQIYAQSNSCEGVRLCLNNIYNNKILICDGSIIFNEDILNFITKNNCCIAVEEQENNDLEIGVNIGEKGYIEHFGFGAHTIWSEMIYLNNEDIIDSLRKIISGDNYKNKFLFEGLNELIKTKHKLAVVKNDYPINKINNIKTYHKLREYL